MSVLQTGMIPNFRFGPDGRHYDVSGLGFVQRKSTHYRVPAWRATGVRYEPGVLEPRENIPFPADEDARPQDHVSELIDGFTQTYRFLGDRRGELRAWIRTAATLPVRYLIRETMEYYEALQCNRGIEQTTRLPPLASPCMVFSSLIEQEKAALARLDIPRFLLAAGDNSLSGLERCFHRSGVALALAGIEELSAKELAKQVRHIRLSWSLSRVSAALPEPKGTRDIIPSL